MPLGITLLHVPDRFPRAPIPDNDRAAAILTFGDSALEGSIFERMILHMDRETLLARHQAWSLCDRPAFQDTINLQAQIIMQAARRVFLDDEAVAGRLLAPPAASRLRRRLEVALLVIGLKRHLARLPARGRTALRVGTRPFARSRLGCLGCFRALAQGIEQVDHLLLALAFRLLDLLTFRLRLDQISQRLIVFVIESAWVELAALGVDDVTGKIQHLAFDLQLRKILENVACCTNLVVIVQGIGDEPWPFRA